MAKSGEKRDGFKDKMSINEHRTVKMKVHGGHFKKQCYSARINYH